MNRYNEILSENAKVVINKSFHGTIRTLSNEILKQKRKSEMLR